VPASVPDAKSVGRVQLPVWLSHNPFCISFVCPTSRTRLLTANAIPSIVCSPVSVRLVVATTTAGLCTVNPLETALSTYAFVVASVGLVTVPSSDTMLVLKLPDASRMTSVFAVLFEVAAFASNAPATTVATDCPPSVLTVVLL